MALKLRVATHSVDAPGVFVSLHDDAWDQERKSACYLAFIERFLKEKQDAAVAKHRKEHPGDELTAEAEAEIRKGIELSDQDTALALLDCPTVRFARGRTRYQLDAPDRDASGAPVTARSYLKDEPTQFVLRRMSHAVYAQTKVGEKGSHQHMVALVTHGLREIISPGDGFKWHATGDRVPDHIIQMLHDNSHTLIAEIANAVEWFNRPLDEDDELPR